MFKRFFLSTVAFILALFSVSFLLPKSFDVSRQVEIHAPASSVFSLVGDLRNWRQWTKWAEEDPNAQYTYGETTSGVGGSFSWRGDKHGGGTLRITEFEEDKLLGFEMIFPRWQGTPKGRIEIQPSNEGYVTVKWSMHGTNEGNPLRRLMGFMFDRRLGKNFEQSLQNLKGKIEAAQGGANQLPGDIPDSKIPHDESVPSNVPPVGH